MLYRSLYKPNIELSQLKMEHLQDLNRGIGRELCAVGEEVDKNDDLEYKLGGLDLRIFQVSYVDLKFNGHFVQFSLFYYLLSATNYFKWLLYSLELFLFSPLF
eukprot:TRINITY_DN26753_c0_g1_i3.p1 TRINITY_DN26753_c0_g1~~TRINITY_DN26753_c0_g1_i3.p1  ORF type:complete len:103 (-),score=8.66 TRINITY_DN26753_c0_g1_i3:233-541(-)